MRITIDIANEPSTYRGVAVVIGVAIALVNPDLIAQLTAAAVGVSGLIGIFFKDGGGKGE
jgi:hypothetical protein